MESDPEKHKILINDNKMKRVSLSSPSTEFVIEIAEHTDLILTKLTETDQNFHKNSEKTKIYESPTHGTF